MSRERPMELGEAKRILALVASNPDHGTQGAFEDQDIAAQVILKELRRLESENTALRRKLT